MWCIRLPTPSTTTRPLSLLRCCGHSFLLKLFQRGRILLFRRTWLIELRLQEFTI
jgi:hypothetical protein